MAYPITIAYNIQEKKVGCVLIQRILHATVPTIDISYKFNTESWEIGNISQCKLYKLYSQDEYDMLVEITNEAHPRNKTKLINQKQEDETDNY